MSNPLIDKFYELHPEKKEKPKSQKPPIVEYFDEVGTTPPQEVIEKLRQLQPNSKVISSSSTSVSYNPKPPSLTSYDPHSTEDSFLQVAELVKQNKAKIISMNMSVDATGELFAKTISFEIMVADWDTP